MRPASAGRDRPVKIRIAEPRDASAIAEAEWATAATPGMLVGRPGEIPLSAFGSKIVDLSGMGCYLVAEEDGVVVGHAFLDPMRMTGNAHVFQLNIVVHPGRIGQGVGRALMSELMAWARGRTDLEKIELLVREVNTRAIALYRDLGFVEEGRLRRRVRTADGEFLDDVAMAWIPDSAGSR